MLVILETSYLSYLLALDFLFDKDCWIFINPVLQSSIQKSYCSTTQRVLPAYAFVVS